MSRQTPVSVTQQFPDLKRWEQSTVLEAPSSSELMAGSKIFGRECSNVYVSFLKCKMEKGEHPGVCINESQLNILCTKNVLANIKQTCEKQFKEYEACLDRNDYRIEGCLSPELDLITCWNNRQTK